MGKTRRWGVKSLQKQQQQQQQQQQQTDRALPSNAFPAVALPWAAALLQECDVERHGVDLFNRDPLLLGRLLITLVSVPAPATAAPAAPATAGPATAPAAAAAKLCLLLLKCVFVLLFFGRPSSAWASSGHPS